MTQVNTLTATTFQRITHYLRVPIRKLVVFTDSRVTLQALIRQFPQAAAFSPDMLPAQRLAAYTRFRTDPDCRLFLADLRAAAVGLNLSAADEAFFALQYAHRAAVLIQAKARVHRPNSDLLMRWEVLPASTQTLSDIN
jgi:hypothetical protein